MIPTSVIALAIVVVVVLPGSMYTWACERQISVYGVNLADRALRFVALSDRRSSIEAAKRHHQACA